MEEGKEQERRKPRAYDPIQKVWRALFVNWETDPGNTDPYQEMITSPLNALYVAWEVTSN